MLLYPYLIFWKSHIQQHGYRLAFDPWWLPCLPSFLKCTSLLCILVLIKHFEILFLKIRNRSRDNFVVTCKTAHLGLLYSSNRSQLSLEVSRLLESLGPSQTLGFCIVYTRWATWKTSTTYNLLENHECGMKEVIPLSWQSEFTYFVAIVKHYTNVYTEWNEGALTYTLNDGAITSSHNTCIS